MKKRISITIGILILLGVFVPAIASAINVTVPLASSSGYALVSTTTGSWIATTTDPLHVGSLYASSTSEISKFNGSVTVGGTLNSSITNTGNFTGNAFYLQPSTLGSLVGGYIPDAPGLPIVDFGINANQFGSPNPSYNGGIFRLDSRGTYPFFQVLYQPAGDNGNEQVPFGISNPNADNTMPSVMIMPGDGENVGTGNGENLQVYNDASIGAQLATGGAPDYTPSIPGILGVGMSPAQYAIDVYDKKVTGYDIGDSTTGDWHIDNGGNASFASGVVTLGYSSSFAVASFGSSATFYNGFTAGGGAGGPIMDNLGQLYYPDDNILTDSNGDLFTGNNVIYFDNTAGTDQINSQTGDVTVQGTNGAEIYAGGQYVSANLGGINTSLGTGCVTSGSGVLGASPCAALVDGTANTWTMLQTFAAGINSTASSTIQKLSATNGTTTNATSTNLYVSSHFSVASSTPSPNFGVNIGTTTLMSGAITNTASASSTFSQGINITAGCFSISNVCVGGSSGSGIVGSGIAGELPFYNANGTTLTATSSIVIGTTTTDNGNVGIGVTNPIQKLEVGGNQYDAGGNFFLDNGYAFQWGSGSAWVTANASANTMNLVLNNSNVLNLNGTKVGIGTTTPMAILSTVAASSTVATGPYQGIVSMTAGFENTVAKLFEEIDQWGHLITSGDTPAIVSCGSSSVSGNDRNGTITLSGTLITSCTLTFAHAYVSAPDVVASDSSLAASVAVTSVSASSVTFGLSTGLNTGSISYIVQAHQ